jgi:hypothetical protein
MSGLSVETAVTDVSYFFGMFYQFAAVEIIQNNVPLQSLSIYVVIWK